MQTLGLTILAFIAIFSVMAWRTKDTQQKTYTLTLTAHEVQVVYDALGELPAKTTETIRGKIAQQVTSQNQQTDKK